MMLPHDDLHLPLAALPTGGDVISAVPSSHFHLDIFPNWDSGAASHNKLSK